MRKEVFLILAMFFIASCAKAPVVTNFEECVAAGYPVMESYPRQCRADSQTFVEAIEPPEEDGRHACSEEEKAAEACTLEYMPVCGNNGQTYGNDCSACASGEIDSYIAGECALITLEQAVEIAFNSECTDMGALQRDAFYNENSETWWIGLELYEPKEGCSPACVVGKGRVAEINYRCTGLLEP